MRTRRGMESSFFNYSSPDPFSLSKYEIDAKLNLVNFMKKYKTNGIDILSASLSYLKNRDDHFYKEILEEGRVLYEQDSGDRVA